MAPRARRSSVTAEWRTIQSTLLLGALVLASLLIVGMSTNVEARARVVRAGGPTSGKVSLTFDDGSNRSACARITKTLRAHGVKGTFFINGMHVKNAPAAWRRILKGMAVGNHTRLHLDLPRQSDRVIRNEIRTNEAIHERFLRRPMQKFFRPPYGSFNVRVRRIAGRLGYAQMVLWNVSTRDWSASATVASVVARATDAPPGSIILMHCMRSVTPSALPAIIRHYEARGIKLVGLKRLLRQ
jgi:peptidoglycan/xylan/chitin deacetylase (PgdA/CDA1 family)